MLGWLKEELWLWRGAYVARTNAIKDAAIIVANALEAPAEADEEPEEPEETPEMASDRAWSEWVNTSGADDVKLAWAHEARRTWLLDKGEMENGEDPEDVLMEMGVPREAWG